MTPKPGHIKRTVHMCPYCGKELNLARLKEENIFYCAAAGTYVRLCVETNGNACNGWKTCKTRQLREKHVGER